MTMLAMASPHVPKALHSHPSHAAQLEKRLHAGKRMAGSGARGKQEGAPRVGEIPRLYLAGGLSPSLQRSESRMGGQERSEGKIKGWQQHLGSGGALPIRVAVF
jgi:hypothetical protein